MPLYGNKYYISPNGNDSNPGTISQPFFTLNKVWTVITSGDTAYLRGGTYEYVSSQKLTGKNGTAGNRINIWAYPGEVPIITKAVSFNYYYACGIYFVGNYFHFKGLEITGFLQLNTSIYTGLRVQNSNHNVFELLNSHHNGHGMSVTQSCDDNLILNCDFHHNFDPLTPLPYDNADGLEIGDIPAGLVNRVKGCRFWWNTDDGLDLWRNDGFISIDSCWAWNNGYIPDTFTAGGNGNGFKLGKTEFDHSNTILRTIKNCVAYNNRDKGFDQNMALCSMELYNNTSYLNDNNGLKLDFFEIFCIVKNGISYKNGIITVFSEKSIVENCTFLYDGTTNYDYSLSDDDFINLDGTQLTRSRKANGSLPDIDFLHLKPGSDLIDSGSKVGLPYGGSSPDLGAFELYSGTSAPLPVYISSSIYKDTPTVLEMTYNLSLNNLLPAASAFDVRVNSASRVVNSVIIENDKVNLILASPVVFGDIITVAYIKPASNPLQTISGGEAESISAQSVMNKCPDPAKPEEPPVVVINYQPSGYSGFVYEIDASDSYDSNFDDLTFVWTVPNQVSVSSKNNSKVQFLAPDVIEHETMEFIVSVSDGTLTQTRSISINIEPYKPELTSVRIIKTEASDYFASDFPNNIRDSDTATIWSAKGNNQWILAELAVPTKISHLKLTFRSGQRYSSYFNIYASKDNIIWESILINPVSSCNFSGNPQVFDFPAQRTNTDYMYLKYVGKGNALNDWNRISEFKIFGVLQQKSGSANNDSLNIVIYPNPAENYFNISIEEPTLNPDVIRIIDFSGKIVYEEPLETGIKNVLISKNLIPGVYIVNLLSKGLILGAKKLIIKKEPL